MNHTICDYENKLFDEELNEQMSMSEYSKLLQSYKYACRDNPQRYTNFLNELTARMWERVINTGEKQK